MTDEELTKVLEDANAGRLSKERIGWEIACARITWDGAQWVKRIPNPLWEQIQKESKSGGELYQRLSEGGYFKSNFPKGFYG